MRYMALDEFEHEFPKREPIVAIDSIIPGGMTVDRDTAIYGIVNGDVSIRDGAQAHVSGIITGSVRVDAGGLLYLNGIVNKDVRIEGAACIAGLIRGALNGSDDACIGIDGARLSGAHASG